MRFLRASLLLSAVLLLAIAGCRHDDEIRQETITQDDRESIHLRVAILRHKDAVWFFRIDGPDALVEKHLAAFDDLVKSVTFGDKDDGPIKWTEPASWKKDPPRKEPFASYRIDAKPKELEVKITKLEAAKYKLMNNMHRWQKQVNLPLSEKEEDNEPYIKRDKVGENEVTWVNMTGLGVHTVSVPFDPKAAHDQELLAGMMNKGGGIPFKYTAPEGWVKIPPRDAIILELFEVGDKKTELTLSIAKGDPAMNINRWRGQVGLGEMSEKDEKAVKTVAVAGIKSIYVDLANPGGPPAKNRTLGVIVPMRNRSFFFIKMTGPIDGVERHKDEFETFLKSFK